MKPLAARMRPTSFEEVEGQDHLLGPSAPFKLAVDAGRIPSVLFWGPPGCGKTTIARLMANNGGHRFEQLSAVMSGVKDLKKLMPSAEPAGLFAGSSARPVLLFVDEIHRWNKAQQDALLPHVEEGRITLVGATTENPAFHVIPALRSRTWLLQIRPLEGSHVVRLLRRALEDPERGLGTRMLTLADPALEILAAGAGGDARAALSLLERVANAVPDGTELGPEHISEVLGRPDLGHDRSGDAHFDVVSAFIKSLRGSSPDGALYWMARMLEGGEDPMFLARRMVVFASEDIGNADPRALPLATAAMQATHLLGMPEARIVLGQACTWLACAPKSNASYLAIDKAIQAVRQGRAAPVPVHLRNAPTRLAKVLGHGAEYRYPHDFPNHIVAQEYLPDGYEHMRFYSPTQQGAERVLAERMEWWQHRLLDNDSSE